MDFDNDGKKDLVAGDSPGNIWFFKNVGTATQPRLAAGVQLKADGKLITAATSDITQQLRNAPKDKAFPGSYSKLHVADWDGDGLLDILVGQDGLRTPQDQLIFYRNIGTAKDPKFAAPTPMNVLKQPLTRPSPYVVDWDGDGKRDLLMGTEMNKVMFLRNTGTNERPEYAAPEEIQLPGLDKECYRCRIAVVDWNNDGKLDLLVGTFYSSGDRRGGNIWLFLRK